MVATVLLPTSTLLVWKETPGCPKMIGTPWAYLICARAIAHACALQDVRFEGIDSGWVQASVPARNKGRVVMLGLPGSGNWRTVTLALSPTSPHVGQFALGVTAVCTPPGMYICFQAETRVLGLGGVLVDLLKDEWQETADEEEESEPVLPVKDTGSDSDSDCGDLIDWLE